MQADKGIHISGGKVTQWDDQSGKGNNAVQANASFQPTIINNAVWNKPAIQFDGIGQYMTLTSTLNLTDYSIFIVYQNKVTGSSSAVIADNGSADGCFMSFCSGNCYLIQVNGGSNYIEVTPPIVNNKYGLFEDVQNGNSTYIWANATLLTITNQAQPLTGITLNSLAKNNYGYFDGDIVEIIIYNTRIIPTQRQSIENYVRTKYKI